MTRTQRLLAIAVGLVLAGVVLFILQPGSPEAVCAPDQAKTSGFTDPDKNCAISIESWKEISDYHSSPKPLRIAGLVLILGGIGIAVTAAVTGRKGRSSADPASAPSAPTV